MGAGKDGYVGSTCRACRRGASWSDLSAPNALRASPLAWRGEPA